MSLELTSRFLDRLRLVELITAICILVALTVVLSAWGDDDATSPGTDVVAIHRSAQPVAESHLAASAGTHARAS